MVPVGRPLAYVRAVVLDRRLAAVPRGVPGELCLGGAGLGRGYGGRPGETAATFLPDPGAGGSGIPSGARLYRTGDRARQRASGSFEVLGRLDQQVKLRGFRVEPGEVERVLAANPAVRQAAVVVREEQGELRLAAFAVLATAGGGTASTGVVAAELRRHLAEHLPGYMVPSAVALLPEIPLTVTGKVDRRALLALPSESALLAAGEALQGPVEEALAEIWREVLGPGTLPGRHDDFFELGGHSLMATRVLARVRRVFQVELPLRHLFEAPTVAGLAVCIEAALGADGAALERPLVRWPRPGPTALSFAQQRLWFLHRLEPESAAYHVPSVVSLHGELSVAGLAAALAGVVARHEVLRTRFVEEEGEPVQVVGPPPRVPLPVVDLTALASEGRLPGARELAAAESRLHFDLARGPVLRGLLLRLAEREHVLAVTLHHIVTDGWSGGLLVREVAALYRQTQGSQVGGSQAQGIQDAPLPELGIQYADYALWQRALFADGLLDDQLAYWRRQLADPPGALALPTDRPRPAVQGFAGAALMETLPAELAAGVAEIGRRLGATPFMTLLAGFFALLGRYSGDDDLLVGTPIANRRHWELEPLIGFFVNTLVLRGDLGRRDGSGRPGFGELVARVRSTALGAYAHQDLPFERLVEEVAPERQLGAHPLFQVLFVVQNAPAVAVELPGLSLSSLEVHTGTSKFDLALFLAPRGGDGAGGFEAALELSTDLFDLTTGRRLLGHYRALLTAALADPLRPLDELPLLAPAEAQQLAREWQGPADLPPSGQRLEEAIAARAALHPHRVAVVSGSELLTYGDLMRRAGTIASRLAAENLGAEARVGIFLEPDLDLLPALVGVLAAGCAYVPLDPAHPAERLALLLEDAGVSLVLTRDKLRSLLPPSPTPVLPLEDIGLAPAAGSEGPGGVAERNVTEWSGATPPGLSLSPVSSASSGIGPGGLAYVLYTSGSTGRPKGVGVEHRSLLSFLASMARRPGLDEETVLLAVTTLTFDIAALELFGPLLAGGRVVMAGSRAGADGRRLGELLERYQATALQATPATWQLLLAAGWPGRPGLEALCGGEALPEPLAAELSRRAGRVWNLYGPTETTVWSAVERVGERVTIGRPIHHTDLHVLDRRLAPSPTGTVGELAIGGVGLARGYLAQGLGGRPALTAAAFVPHPAPERPGERLYRTGDLARFLPDGRLDVLGRRDHQIKLRGFRIEPGEIEAALGSHPAVSQAVVQVYEEAEGPGDRRLAAYVVPDPTFQDRADRVEAWGEVWDQTYRQAGAAADAGFDLAGWNSALTGEPLPAAEMAEWVEGTVERLLSAAPRTVLEIGCGTGLLLFRLAPQVEQYTALDVSAGVVAAVQAEATARGLSQVEVRQAAAHQLTGFAGRSFDLIVLNSVVQYFPDAGYLEEVLTAAASFLAPRGALFVGDVRSLPLLPALHAEIELRQAPDDLSLPDLAARVRRLRAEERELILAPAFFADLAERLPQRTRALAELKRGRSHNELTRFRYDVWLTAEEREAASQTPGARELEGRVGLAEVRAHLEAALAAGEGLSLRRAPNARLAAEAELLAQLSGADEEGAPSAGTLRAALEEAREARPGLDPEVLWQLATDLGCAATVGPSAEDPTCLEAVFLPRAVGGVASFSRAGVERPAGFRPAEQPPAGSAERRPPAGAPGPPPGRAPAGPHGALGLRPPGGLPADRQRQGGPQGPAASGPGPGRGPRGLHGPAKPGGGGGGRHLERGPGAGTGGRGGRLLRPGRPLAARHAGGLAAGEALRAGGAAAADLPGPHGGGPGGDAPGRGR